MTTRNPEHTGITINGKPYGNPDRDFAFNVREGIRQMTADGDEMLISGKAMLMNGWAFQDGVPLIKPLSAADIPFSYSHGRAGFSDHYFIRRTGL